MIGETCHEDFERQSWEEEFEAAARRPLAVRLRYAFIRTYKPVLDDVPYRSFDHMADYRCWCELAPHAAQRPSRAATARADAAAGDPPGAG
jgi:hypothetical protein